MSRKITHIDLFVAAVKSMGIGLGLTLKHFIRAIGIKRREQVGMMNPSYFHQPDGIVTNLYPFESIPVPDNGRYRLHNEIEDCIVCDLCAKVCPVDCIDIEPIKSPVEISKTSDGSTKRIFAAKFDIDMAKCCYCGLCTTVCPTECLTMTKTYDFSEYDVSNMVYHFAEMSPAEAVIKKEEMDLLAQEEKAKKAAVVTSKEAPASQQDAANAEASTSTPKPVFKPKVSIPASKAPNTSSEQTAAESSSISEGTDKEVPLVPKPVFKPKAIIPAKKPRGDDSQGTPGMPPSESSTEQKQSGAPAKPVFKPKPVIPAKKPIQPTEQGTPDPSAEDTSSIEPLPRPKPVMKPIMKPIIPKKKEDEEGEQNV